MVATGWCDQDAPTHPLDAHLDTVDTDDLPDIMEKRYLRVLTTMNRTNFFLAGPKVHGFEYALLKEYEKHLNQRLKRPELKMVLEFIPVSRDRLLKDLVDGYGDIAAAGLTITDERSRQVAFTRPYLSNIAELLVTYKTVPVPASASDLSGKKVFVRKSSSYYESLMSLNRKLKEQGKRPVKIIEADENLETEDILEMINSGAIKRTVCDSHLAHIWEKVLHNITVHDEIKVREGAKIAWAVRQDNPQLLADLNVFLKTHRKGTLLGNIYFNRYYEENDWIINPMGGDAVEKIKRYRPLFEKYAAAYDFDWQLILAMAFQESGLNHKKKSKAGAVGVMQIKPSTAADRQVGIGNVFSEENNIHAAVKYLAFLRNRYFSDPGIRPRDQVRFALAAYNAGPAKIRNARKQAKQMNLNPDQWFRNVEMAVLRKVGQETVRYVSNINKYYVIYKNALAVTEAKEKVINSIQ